MLHKQAKTPSGGLIKRGIKTFIVFETFLFFGAWIGWQQLRSNRNSRLYLKKNLPYLLDKYYSFEEYTSPELQNRIADLDIWQREGRLRK